MLNRRRVVSPELGWSAKVLPRIVKFLTIGIASLALVSPCHAYLYPVCPSGGAKPHPPFGQIGKAPSFYAWIDLDKTDDVNCYGLLQNHSALAVALAGRFRHTGTIDNIASRLGAISLTKGLPYWSTTDRKWRILVSDAFALETPDTDAVRPDFTAKEILSSRTLYFAQNDTRSSGVNIYTIKTIAHDRDHFVFETTNMTPIRYSIVTLFKPQSLKSILFFRREDKDIWSYYGLSAVTRSTFKVQEKSFINRQAALCRFLTRQAPDQDPPLAP